MKEEQKVWCRGSKDNPEGVIRALEKRGGKNVKKYTGNIEDILYYINTYGMIDSIMTSVGYAEWLMTAWQEIQPEPKEQPKPKFKKDDKVRIIGYDITEEILESMTDSFGNILYRFKDTPYAWLKESELELVTEPQFKPFDKVIGKSRGVWTCDFYSYYDETEEEPFPYVCVGDSYKEILPYNEQTAKLIGTTDDYNENQD